MVGAREASGGARSVSSLRGRVTIALGDGVTKSELDLWTGRAVGCDREGEAKDVDRLEVAVWPEVSLLPHPSDQPSGI